MTRLSDWRTRYNALIDDIRAKPFEDGSHECFKGLAVPVLVAIRGDAGKFSTARYKTMRGGLGLMKRRGFANLADVLASELTEIHPSRATVGDLAAIPAPDSPFGYAIGVVNGDRVFVLLDKSLGTRSLMEVERAFSVD